MIKISQRTVLTSLFITTALTLSTPEHPWAMDIMDIDNPQAQTEELSQDEIKNRARIFLDDLYALNPGIREKWEKDTLGEKFIIKQLLLGKLHLIGNKLKALPESIGNLVNITWISAGGNQLITLPDGIGKLVNLETVYLQGNDLRGLPDSIGNCKMLKELYLNNNPNLKNLPITMGNLTNLGWVSAGETNIKGVPRHIQKAYDGYGDDIYEYDEVVIGFTQKDLQHYIQQEIKNLSDFEDAMDIEKSDNLLSRLPGDLKGQIKKYR